MLLIGNCTAFLSSKINRWNVLSANNFSYKLTGKNPLKTKRISVHPGLNECTYNVLRRSDCGLSMFDKLHSDLLASHRLGVVSSHFISSQTRFVTRSYRHKLASSQTRFVTNSLRHRLVSSQLVSSQTCSVTNSFRQKLVS